MESVRLIKNPPAGVRVSEIAPSPDIPPGRMTTNMKILNAVYQSGREHGKRFIEAYKA
jgi:predicted patatin/cPLA2 family phospholipase